MSKTIAKIALIAALAASSAAPVAYANPGRHNGGRHASNHGNHDGGRGHWRNGKWIALGILGAAAAVAIADSEYRNCYYRYGHRYCD